MGQCFPSKEKQAVQFEHEKNQAMQSYMDIIDDLEEKQRTLERQCSEILSRARTVHAQHKKNPTRESKRNAIKLMKSLLMPRKQIKNIESRIAAIRAQCNMLQTTDLNRKIVKATEQTNRLLQKYNINNDVLAEHTDQMSQAIEDEREVNDVLSEMGSGGMIDDDELLAELEMEVEEYAGEHYVSSLVDNLPRAPSTTVENEVEHAHAHAAEEHFLVNNSDDDDGIGIGNGRHHVASTGGGKNVRGGGGGLVNNFRRNGKYAPLGQ